MSDAMLCLALVVLLFVGAWTIERSGRRARADQTQRELERWWRKRQER